jgi:hypothetical protein
VNDLVSPRRRLRGIGAVFAGFLATFALSIVTDVVMHAAGWFPALGQPMSDPFYILAATYRAAYTVVGGYVTAGLAPDRPMAHARVLAVIGVIAGMAGVVAYWVGGPELGPAWYAISIPVSAVPCIWAGARLRVWQARAHASLH